MSMISKLLFASSIYQNLKVLPDAAVTSNRTTSIWYNTADPSDQQHVTGQKEFVDSYFKITNHCLNKKSS